MCGIAGWIDWGEDLTSKGSVLEKMVRTLAKRGPDAEGFWLSPRAALGHRRLSVIDPKNGGQPMVCKLENSTYTITYNGELYNFKELRNELKSYGHTFRTQSDTEVLIHAYIEWAENCVDHLNGIFAFAIWDETRQQLFMVRDHLGVKPLFYAQRGNAVIFGSELKALLAHPQVKAEVDHQGLTELFCFGLMHTPGTAIFRNVQEVRAGHSVLCKRNGIYITRYWKLESKHHPDNLETTTEYIRGLLEDTVKRQLIADVPVVTMLSGGLDSSLLTAHTAREFQKQGKTIHTYSIDFVGSQQDFKANAVRPDLDAPWVKKVSDYLKTEHHTIVIDTPELMENHLVSLYAHDLPGMGEIETSLYILCREMKKNATVALSGESADEIFGGYAWFYQPEILQVQNFPFLLGPFPFMVKRMLHILSKDLEDRLNSNEYVARRYQESLLEIPFLDGEDKIAAKRREIFYHHIIRFLPLILSRKDRMSMLAGFEVRVPFCDYRLVEYVWNIPWEMKNVDNIEKGILRRASVGLLPHDVLYRKKCSYPGNQSLTYSQALRDWTLDILNESNSPIIDLIDTQTVRAIAQGKASLPREFESYVLNFIIQTNVWLKDYKITLC